MSLFKKFLFLFVAVALALVLPFAAQAIPLNEALRIANNGGLATYTTATDLLTKILLAVLSLAFLVAVIFVVISGYRMVVSAGNPDQVEAAKKNLYWGIGGIVVVVLAWAMLELVVNVVKTGQA